MWIGGGWATRSAAAGYGFGVWNCVSFDEVGDSFAIGPAMRIRTGSYPNC